VWLASIRESSRMEEMLQVRRTSEAFLANISLWLILGEDLSLGMARMTLILMKQPRSSFLDLNIDILKEGWSAMRNGNAKSIETGRRGGIELFSAKYFVVVVDVRYVGRVVPTI
jgi:hypothetical protein